jgi:acyl-coenzyme A thioesterase PaaI-like protein
MADLGVVASLPIHKQLSPAEGSQVGSARIKVLPRPRISAWAGGAINDPCAAAAADAAGATTAFTVNAATVGTAVTYQWSVSGAAGQSASNTAVFHVALPTTVKTSVTVSVVVTFSGGCSSSGSLALTTSDPALAELGRHLCEFLRSIDRVSSR